MRDRSFLNDGRAEGGHSPQTLEAIPGLDIKAIKAWWASYRTQHGYQLHWNNCARTVFNAIWAGGGKK